jgi:CHRD domain
MKRKLALATVLAVAIALGSLLGMQGFAGSGKANVSADLLTGYQEATPAGVATDATGTFDATIDDGAGTITYRLTYQNLTGPALFSHIHFGNRFDSGGVSVFLCGGGPQNITCPAGTTSEAVVTGTLTANDVIGPTSQGIGVHEFGKLVDAIRAGATYVNVHSPMFPMGEIRGQINDDNQRQPA